MLTHLSVITNDWWVLCANVSCLPCGVGHEWLHVCDYVCHDALCFSVCSSIGYMWHGVTFNLLSNLWRPQAWARSPQSAANSPLHWNRLVKTEESGRDFPGGNFQILIVSAVKICKQCLQTASSPRPHTILGLRPG